MASSACARRCASAGVKLARAATAAPATAGRTAGGEGFGFVVNRPQVVVGGGGGGGGRIGGMVMAMECWRSPTMVQAQLMSCCAKVDNPPPREVVVEYDEESDYTDYFIEIADKVENAHPELFMLVSPNNTEARKGSFEITCEGHVLWSKLKTGRLPRFEDVLDGIADLPSKCEVEPAVANSSA